jgi:uncharacterized damage-inducible protein DinB
MQSLTPVLRLHEHRMWTNRNLRDAARKCSAEQLDQAFEIGLGTLRKTLTHLHAAESVWLMTLKGETKTPSPFDLTYGSFAELESAWDRSEQSWSAMLASMTDADLTKPVKKTASITGEVYTTPTLDVLLHVCVHAQYHAAQAVNMLRRLGVPGDELPETMVISMSRAQHN